MGSALVRGLVRAGGVSPQSITIFDADAEKARGFAAEFGLRSAESGRDAITAETELLVLAVKPQILGGVVGGLADLISDRPVVVSIAAGTSTGFILSFLGPDARVIRAMPNAAAMVGRSVTAICKAGLADDDDLERARELFSAFGSVVVVEEKMMNVVTAISGSGPGYLFALMEAMTDGGVLMGLDRPTARELTVRTFAGAAALAAADTTSFSELKDRVTSPGGTTIAGLQALEEAGMRGALMDVIEAATKRGDELQAKDSS